jgi:hypothetical protein
MKKQLVLILARDVETSMKILAVAIEEENTILAQEALANATNELAGIRKLLEELTQPKPGLRLKENSRHNGGDKKSGLQDETAIHDLPDGLDKNE